MVQRKEDYNPLKMFLALPSLHHRDLLLEHINQEVDIQTGLDKLKTQQFWKRLFPNKDKEPISNNSDSARDRLAKIQDVYSSTAHRPLHQILNVVRPYVNDQEMLNIAVGGVYAKGQIIDQRLLLQRGTTGISRLHNLGEEHRTQLMKPFDTNQMYSPSTVTQRISLALEDLSVIELYDNNFTTATPAQLLKSSVLLLATQDPDDTIRAAGTELYSTSKNFFVNELDKQQKYRFGELADIVNSLDTRAFSTKEMGELLREKQLADKIKKTYNNKGQGDFFG